MSRSSAMNSAVPTEEKQDEVSVVKMEVTVKEETLECVVCGVKSRECLDIYTTRTPSGASLHHFLAKYTQVDLAFTDSCTKQSCKSCSDLINELERAELEYVKFKEAFEAIISKNPLFELSVVSEPIGLSDVKREFAPDAEDSEDEPLARRKTNRSSIKNRSLKKKKKLTGKPKRKKSTEKNSWECEECGATGAEGGPIALAAHKITVHTELAPIKIEDGSQSPFNNGNDDLLDVAFGHFDDDDDDDDSNFNPDEFDNESDKKKEKKKPTEKKKPKVMHPCDQCSSRYSSLARLEAHKAKHDGSKPPYICEVCGAHYKHKRACDIHIALHKGISDWKCEECNKLFPSKNALQRHNNIHTGKLNYQCDLCGKSFIHTSSFKMHKLSHSGIKPHSCRVCGLALMTRSHLKRHERIHSGEKRHECTACGKRFSERYNLAAHMKSHESAATPPPAAERRRPMFRCQFCTERFERRYMLERHMSSVHGRTLERPPPTPRNTMSKLLKQRAQRPAHPAHPAPPADKGSPEPERSPPPAPAPPAPALPSSKLLAQLTSSASIITTGSWSGAYAAEFGLRHDYPH